MKARVDILCWFDTNHCGSLFTLNACNPYTLVAYCSVWWDGECGGSEGSAGQGDHRTRPRRPPLTIAARIVCAPRSSFVPRRVGEKGLMYPATARDRTDSLTAGCRRKQGHCLPRMSTANWAVGSGQTSSHSLSLFRNRRTRISR